MLKPSEVLKNDFERLRLGFDTDPEKADRQLMTLVHNTSNALRIASEVYNDPAEAVAIRRLLQNNLFEQGMLILGRTHTGGLAPRWNLKAATYFTVAAQLAGQADETRSLRSRATSAERAFRQAYPNESEISDPHAVADLMALQLNAPGIDRYGIPVSLRKQMVPSHEQTKETIRRVGAVVAALRTHEMRLVHRGPVPTRTPSDPRPSLRNAYGGTWQSLNTHDVLSRGGTNGDIDLMWGRVIGGSRLLVRTVKSNTGLLIDVASMSVAAAISDERDTDKHPWMPSAAQYDLMRVPPLQKEFTTEVDRAKAVARELEMGAFKDDLGGLSRL